MTATAPSQLGAQTAPVEERPVVLEVRDLCVDYGLGPTGVRAIHHVDLVLHRGEVLGLAGESGSGKSTMAYAMTRLLRSPGVITGGDVYFHDARPAGAGGLGTVPILDASPDQLRQLRWSEVAIVFQSAMHALNPVLNVQAQLTDVLAAHRRDMTKSDRRDRAAHLLELVSINPDRLKSYPHELSGGMRQRVMIAMALALDPQVVIMDEPTTALDVVTQREILSELIELRDTLGFAVLFITHDLSLLIELADSIAVMYAGRLIEQGGANDIFRSPRHPYTRGLLSSFPSLHGVKEHMTGIPGSPPDLRSLPTGCAFHPRCDWAMPLCASAEPELLTIAPHTAGVRPPRVVSCWKQRGDADGITGGSGVPAELDLPEPPAATSRPVLAQRRPS
jgi:peptide/nickel transport system ATP-binding protein